MPLTEGYSKEAIGKNIKTESEAGKPQAQAVAISYAKARETLSKLGASRRAQAVKNNPSLGGEK
ncbi:MAG TPA: hypothetical protein VJ553_05380 [Candidatus Paceibacterota bacterium]|nr:hypothetical protein [Candidatus Paceibacterota bacterium]